MNYNLQQPQVLLYMDGLLVGGVSRTTGSNVLGKAVPDAYGTPLLEMFGGITAVAGEHAVLRTNKVKLYKPEMRPQHCMTSSVLLKPCTRAM